MTTTLYNILSYAGGGIFLIAAALLLYQALRGGIHPRARFALAFSLLMWGLVCLASCVGESPVIPVEFNAMSISVLVTGNIFIIICLLYPLELSRHGWINLRNITQLALPGIVIVGFYFGMLALLKQPIRELNNGEGLIEHFGEFNVWYRLVLYLSICFYVAFLLLNTNGAAIQYRQISIGDRTPIDRNLTLRIHIYGIGMTCVTLAYMLILLSGSEVSRLIHRSVVVVFFCIVAWMACISPSQNPKPGTQEN